MQRNLVTVGDCGASNDHIVRQLKASGVLNPGERYEYQPIEQDMQRESMAGARAVAYVVLAIGAALVAGVVGAVAYVVLAIGAALVAGVVGLVWSFLKG